MFKKKIWRRGDKLNAKELNRIEKGIDEALTLSDNIQDAIPPGITYVTIEADGVEHINDTDGAQVTEEIFSMSFHDIITKVKNNETVIFKLNYKGSVTNNHRRIFYCPVRYVEDDRDEASAMYSIYGNAQDKGPDMYIGHNAGPSWDGAVTITEFLNDEITYRAGICIYPFYNP